MTLRELRHSRLLTQAQLAEKAGVALRTIHSIEAGRSAAQIHIRRRLLDALGVPFEQHREVFGDLPRERRARVRP